MSETLLELFPLEARKFLLVVCLSFMIGLQRETRKAEISKGYSFGGVRTFPLIALIGYSIAVLSPENSLAFVLGLAVISAFLWLAYHHKISIDPKAGVTSEILGLFTYLLGALIYREHFWIATSLVVVAMLLLEYKSTLESLVQKIPTFETITFTKFLLLSVVILPILPNQDYTSFLLNPFKTWLVVVAISGISYGSYLLQKWVGNKGGVMLSGILGGAYSSTVATIVLAKRSKNQDRPHLYTGAMLAASGVMYFRLALLVSIFSSALRTRLALMLLILSIAAIAIGVFISKIKDDFVATSSEMVQPKNPLEISSALFFALLFLGMLVLTRVVLAQLGNLGVYVLAIITGVTDVDPFIMSLTQTAGGSTPVQIAAMGILIAASSNNVIKGVYALVFSEKRTGRWAFLALAGLAGVGLLPIIYLTSNL